MAYPNEYGKKMPRVLPDYFSPLNIGAEPGDSGVPQNDMGAIPWADGSSGKDPLDIVIKDGKK